MFPAHFLLLVITATGVKTAPTPADDYLEPDPYPEPDPINPAVYYYTIHNDTDNLFTLILGESIGDVDSTLFHEDEENGNLGKGKIYNFNQQDQVPSKLIVFNVTVL